jgi:DNA primase catalytic core, N-terminal domain
MSLSAIRSGGGLLVLTRCQKAPTNEVFFHRLCAPTTVKNMFRSKIPCDNYKFRLGFAGAGNELVAHFAGRYTRDELLASRLVYARQSDGALQDRFRNRVMIPIQDATGNVVAFSGRRIDGNQDRKYINSATTLIYKKSGMFYNAHRAASEAEGRLVVVEGRSMQSKRTRRVFARWSLSAVRRSIPALSSGYPGTCC